MTSFADKPVLIGPNLRLRPIVASDAGSMYRDARDEEGN